MKKKRIDVLSIILILLGFASAALVYPRLQQQIPIHFNLEGEVDSWAGKSAIYILPVIALALYILFSIFPAVERKGSLNKRISAYWNIVRFIILVVIALNFCLIGYGVGYQIPVDRLLGVLLGLFFVVAGNYMPQLRPNSIAGIRTVWTLKDEDTWRATHRFGGIVTIAAGVLLAVYSLIVSGVWIFAGIMGVTVIWLITSILYSYKYYKAKANVKKN